MGELLRIIVATTVKDLIQANSSLTKIVSSKPQNSHNCSYMGKHNKNVPMHMYVTIVVCCSYSRLLSIVSLVKAIENYI